MSYGRERGISVGERIYTILREEIVTAELKPGQKLSENELAEPLGVSRTPIREALARLRGDRLVAIVPQLGTFVTLISEDAVNDAVFVREALECSAVRLASERISESSLEELQANLYAQSQACSDGNAEAFDLLDEAFHRLICDASGHEIAWTLSRRANGHLDRVRRLSLPNDGYMAEMLSEHHSVLAAISERDPAEAEIRLKEHLRMVLSSLDKIRTAHPDYFDQRESDYLDR